MAYKGSHYQVPSAIHLAETIKDHLVSCGWTLDGPTKDLTSRQAQDDEHAHILGWFLRSTGEDGNNDIAMHIICRDQNSWRAPGPVYDYLQNAGGISNTDVTIELSPGRGTDFSANDVIKIGDELISVGSVSGDTLINCVRGVNGTSAAAHSQYDVLAKTTNTEVQVYMYAFADWANPIASSTATALMNNESCTAFSGLDIYDANTFSHASLIKVRGGTEDGKMRWISTDAGDGSFTYKPFLNGPGTVNADIVSTGFFPHVSRKQLLAGGISKFKSPAPVGVYPGDAIKDVWIYGSKDGFALVVLDGSTYYVAYFGAYIQLNSPLTVATTAALNSGDTVISVGVGNTDIFIPGGKYRILSQSAQDWTNNYDQSGSTYMGATGSGEWPNLDCDETAMEYIVVDSVSSVAGTITIQSPLNYSYQAGAVIGEDPRPICGYAGNKIDGGSRIYMLTDQTSYSAAAACFNAVSKDLAFSTNPAHRRRDRCGLYNIPTNKPWQADGAYDYYNQCEGIWSYLVPFHRDMMDNEENVGNRLPLIPFSLGWYSGADYSSYNAFNRAYGIIPLIKDMLSSLGAQSEDTIQVLWNGAYETFRIFYVPDTAGWIAIGPEIA